MTIFISVQISFPTSKDHKKQIPLWDWLMHNSRELGSYDAISYGFNSLFPIPIIFFLSITQMLNIYMIPSCTETLKSLSISWL